MYDEYFSKAHELMNQGVPFVTAVIVRAEKPTSAKPGDKAIITVDGVMHGWIGGSCAQPTVIKEALKALAADESRLIRLSTEPEKQTPRAGLLDLPMTCYSGGTLEVFIEPQKPRPQLLIFGNLPVAQALVHLGQAMNYHTMVVDPEGKLTADEVITDLDMAVGKIRPFSSYIVVATHGNYDELALEKILKAKPGYVGLVASPKRAQGVRAYLLETGLTETELLPLKAPAGLDIQAKRGDEIALSIMAEIVQRRRSAEMLDLSLFRGSKEREARSEEREARSEERGVRSEEREARGEGRGEQDRSPSFVLRPSSLVPQPSPLAIDPICGMEVDMATAQYKSEFAAETYYFCCLGCKRTFEKNPEAYLNKTKNVGMVGLADILTEGIN